jgi:hypothetical protein
VCSVADPANTGKRNKFRCITTCVDIKHSIIGPLRRS